MAERRNNNRRDSGQGNGQALVVTEPRMTMPASVPTAFGYDANAWRALTDAVFPTAKTPDAVMLALSYCKARNLDPFKRVIHIVPMWSTALGREVETVWPGIGEMRTTASRTGLWAGNDDCQFGRTIRRAFEARKSGQGQGGQPWSQEARCPEIDFPDWAQFTVYKIVGGVRCPFVGPKVRFTETFSGQKGMRVPNDRWQLAPFQMLEKCAEAAALRRAFPDELGDSYASDEMDGKEMRGLTPEQAKYHVADAEGVTAAQQPQQEGEHVEVIDEGDDRGGGGGDDTHNQQQDRDPAKMERYIKNALNFFKKVQTLEALEIAIETEREATARLPDVERGRVQKAEADARTRLAAAVKQDRDTDRGSDAADNASGSSVGPGQGEDKVPDEPPYVRNLRMRIDEVEFIADLMSIEQAEKREIDNLPAWAARICLSMIDEKREALKA